jgi:hypothetical protein
VTRVRAACVLLSLVACGGSPPPSPTVVGNDSPTTTAPLSPRDTLIAQLHASEQVMVIDFSLLPIASYLSTVTEAFPCTAPLIAAKPLVILGSGAGDRREVIITNLDEAATTDCIVQIAPLVGFDITDADGELRVTAGTTTYRVHWDDKVLRISDANTAPTGSIARDLMARIANIPSDAGFWIISSGYPQYQIARSHLWVRLEDEHLILESLADGTTPGAAAKWLAQFEEGFREGIRNAGIELPATPLGTITDEGISARLDARVPLSLFQNATAAP